MCGRPSKVFLGIGNVLRRDDGFGVRVAQAIADLPLPASIDVIDGGTLGLGIADAIEHRDLVLVADSIDAGAVPGRVFRLAPKDLEPFVSAELSVHDLHFLGALDEARLIGAPPREVVVFAVQVADISTGIGLSPSVERAVYDVIDLALDEFGLSTSVLQDHEFAESVWTS